jgi:transcriptional regulator with XRE-family HTH domain
MNLAHNIRVRRAQLDLTQNELAVRAGVSQQLIHALEAGTTKSTKFIKEIAMALGCSVTQLDAKFGTSQQFEDRTSEQGGRLGELPIFAAAETDRGTVVIPDQPIDFMPRPHALLHVRGAYGVLVAVNFMHPEFEVGDHVLINPHLPPIADTSCVFYQESEQGTIGRMRRLTAITPVEWHVKAWNPRSKDDEQSVLPRDSWPQCHRIVGRYFRR